VEFYLTPTTPRNKPYWYSSAQSSITRLIQLQLKELQPRLISLPGFPTDPTSLDTDGVHFSVLAGIAYCQHVVDSARLTPQLINDTYTHSGLSPPCNFFISFKRLRQPTQECIVQFQRNGLPQQSMSTKPQ